jgi:predicted nucleic acid-binding protein
MGLKYLWDTNIVIYYLQSQLSKSGEEFIDNTALNFQPAISVITEIELLCWSAASQTDITLINSFLDNSIIYELDKNIKLKTIEVRKLCKLKVPDAIIAATAKRLI